MVHVALTRITAQYHIQISDEDTCIHSYTVRVTNITVEYDDIYSLLKHEAGFAYSRMKT